MRAVSLDALPSHESLKKMPVPFFSLLVVVFVVRPIGLEIASVFQRLIEAFQNGK